MYIFEWPLKKGFTVFLILGTVLDEDLIVRHLFTLGEVVQLCPGRLPKRVFLLVQSMIATPCITSFPASQPHPLSQNTSSEHSQGDSQLRPTSQNTSDQSQEDSQPGPTSQNTSDHSQNGDIAQASSQTENGSQQSTHSSPDTSRGKLLCIAK